MPLVAVMFVTILFSARVEKYSVCKCWQHSLDKFLKSPVNSGRPASPRDWSEVVRRPTSGVRLADHKLRQALVELLPILLQI